MPFYKNAAQFGEIMTDLFTRTLEMPSAIAAMNSTHLSLRLDTTGPAASFLVDGRVRPPTFLSEAAGARADLILRLPADLLHNIWLGKIGLKDAFFSGQIQLEGPMLRALSLGGLFRDVEALYPQVLTDHGLLPPSESGIAPAP
jgi:putative sterol carrier protein